MNIRNAEPGEFAIQQGDTASTSIALNMAGSCSYCDLHSWIEMCPKMTCACGSTATITAIDKLDGKCVRRCFRCNAVAIWDRP